MRGKKRSETNATGPDVIGPGTGRRITFWVYGLAALLIVLSTASLTFIAYMAWREGDRRALESEQLRLARTLNDVHREVARDQISMAQWDKTFEAVQKPLDEVFIEKELVEGIWEEFGLERTFIVGTSGNLIAQAIEDEAHFGFRQLPPTHPIRRLAERSRSAFKNRQNSSTSAFAQWYMPQSSLLDIAVFDFAIIDGTHAFLSAVPILPDEGQVSLDHEYPAILVNAIYFNDDWTTELNEQLSFGDFRFYQGAPEREHPTNHLVRSEDGTIFGYFRWDHAKPGREIWITALPLVILMTAIIAVVAFAAANKISRLSASLEESERKNRHFARHDPLTGLPNRHHFYDCLSYCLDNLPDKRFAILACDLDRFKPVNDTYGHEVGDRVLCCISDRLRTAVGKSGTVSRVGGDEFLVLLTKFDDPFELNRLAEQLQIAASRPIDTGDGTEVMIGISIGIATAPDCGSSERELIRMADMALYRAKENGRNAFEFAEVPGSRPEQTGTAAT
ncbi:sensor domain-containing diguanylate cyclase [Roseibium sp. SCP14]|uniref:sensor domain-containing diguanylate cyclase n=1 Tax=Roseibium sp. SCP14 TaxID=3141375 RepID=UPI00333709A0